MRIATKLRRLLLLVLGSLVIGIKATAQMDNDTFEHRFRFTSGGGSTLLTLLNATRDLGEEAPSGAGFGEVSLWMAWTPAANGLARLIATSANQTPLRLAVSTRNPDGRVVPLVELPSLGETNFVAETGREYLIAAIGPKSFGGGGLFTVALSPVPANDDRESAVALGADDSHFVASTLGSQDGVTWWRWTPPTEGTLLVQIAPPMGSLSVQVESDEFNRSETWLDGAGLLRNGRVRAGEEVFFRVSGNPWDATPLQVHLQFSSLRLELADGISSAVEGRPLTVTLTGAPENLRFVRCGFSTSGILNDPTAIGDASQLTIPWTPPQAGELNLVGFAVEESGAIWTTSRTPLLVRATHDDFASAKALVENGPAQTVSARGLTTEPGEPEPAEPSLWWKWTASQTESARIRVKFPRGSKGNISLRLFAGTHLQQLLPLQELRMTNSHLEVADLVFPAEQGRNYALAVNTTDTTRKGPELLLLTAQAIPSNDQFADRMPLAGPEVVITNRLAYATSEPGEGPWPSLWYEWTAPFSGELHLSTSTVTNNWASAAVFSQGTFPALQVVPFLAGDGANGYRTPVEAGKIYLITLALLGAAPGFENEPVIFNLQCVPSAPSDQFVNRRVEVGDEVLFAGDTTGAGSEPGEQPTHRRTVWHSWIAPRSGEVVVWLNRPLPFSGGEFNADIPQVLVFEGESLAALTPLPAPPVQRYQPSVFSVVKDHTYQFSVFVNKSRPGGPYEVRLSYLEATLADRFADARPLTGSSVAIPALSRDATSEPGDPQGMTNTLWWSWTASHDGWASLQTPDDVGLFIFIGDRLDSLTAVPTEKSVSDPIQRLRFRAAAGQTYRFATMRPAHPDRPYSILLDLTSLNFAGFSNHDSVIPGQPFTLRLDPVNEALDGTPADGLVEIQITLEDFSRLTKSVPLSEPIWIVTNALPIGVATWEASYVNRDGQLRTSQPFQIVVQHPQDSFGNSPTVTNANWSQEYLFVTATRETNEPASSEWASEGSLWWHWMAPHSGEVVMEHGFAAYQVFTGDSLTTLSPVATRPFPNGFNQETFSAIRGITYHVRLEGYHREDRGILSVKSAPIALAPGLEAVVWPGPEVPLGADVDLTPGQLQRVEFLLDGNAVATATSPPWQAPSPLRSAGAATLTARVLLNNGVWITNLVPVALRWKETNDDVASAVLLEGSFAQSEAATLNASREPGEPSHGATGEESLWNKTLWWKYLSPTNGELLIRVETFLLRDPTPFLTVYDSNLNALAALPPSFTHSDSTLRVPIVAGGVYYLATASQGTGGVRLALTAIPKVPQDQLAAAEWIPEFPALITAHLGLGSLEDGERWPEACRARESFWWQWVAPEDGLVVVKSYGVCTSVSVGPADHRRRTEVQPVSVSRTRSCYPVLSGERYWLGVSTDGSFPGSFNIGVALVGQSSHDEFAQRVSLFGTSTTHLIATQSSSFEPGEPSHPQADVARLRGSVWASWTAPDTGIAFATVEDCAGVVIYRGDRLESLQAMAAGANQALFHCRRGETYLIALLSNRDDPWAAELKIEFQATAPSNDNFDQATVLRGTRAQLQGRIGQATREFGEPIHAGTLCGRSCWWTWTAPISGPTRLQTPSPTFSYSSLAVYLGSSVGRLSEVAATQIGPDGGFLEFEAIAGRAYRIAADGVGEFGDVVELDLVQTVSQAQLSGRPAVSLAGIEFSYWGPGGLTYLLEESRDLQAWTVVKTGTFSGDLESLIQAMDPDAQTQFFRLRSPDSE